MELELVIPHPSPLALTSIQFRQTFAWDIRAGALVAKSVTLSLLVI